MTWIDASKQLPSEEGYYRVMDPGKKVNVLLLYTGGEWRGTPPFTDIKVYEIGYWWLTEG